MRMSLAARFGAALRAGAQNLKQKRLQNRENDRVLNALLTWFFPIFITCLAELNQFVEPVEFFEFCYSRPGVMLFDCLMSYLLFTLLLMLSNRVWLAALTQGLAYMTVSVVELFKYSTNGNHFKLADFTLTPNVKNLTSFAYIKITPQLVLYLLLAAVVLAVIFYQNPDFTRPWRKRILPLLGCFGAYAAVICIPSVSKTVYGVFQVDTREAQNAFTTNEKFENNSMLAFLLETASEKVGQSLESPRDYSEEQVRGALTGKEQPASQQERPNVIVMMSESFADFRALGGEAADTDAYDAFDSVAAQSHVIETVVPTFASYTVRTEFELMFGLPVRSLGDSITPQKEITLDAPDTMASYYKSLGYATAYVHPFVSTFYSRDEIYATYGFDQMLFEDSLTVPAQEYGNGYISDETVVDQLLKLVRETDEPLYVHTTTMQNHQPYDWIEGESELQVYFEGVRATGQALSRLTRELEALSEPTVLLFVGDHFPSMRAQGNIYDALGINSDNCEILYEQPALVWSNFELNTEALPKERISAFYLTPLLLRLTGAPVDTFYETVLDQMAVTPVYTTILLDDERNETLDILTYDRVTGENFSGTRPQEEPDEGGASSSQQRPEAAEDTT